MMQSDSMQLEELLKYFRIREGMSEIVSRDSVSYLEVHPRFLIAGTEWGQIHVLDHAGFPSSIKKINSHSSIINQISIDVKGDYIASCSNDGRVVIHGLYEKDPNQLVNFARPIKGVAIAPDFAKSKQFVTGYDKLLMISKTVLNRTKKEVLHEGDGIIQTIKWHNDMIAWCCEMGIRVYDVRQERIISYMTRTEEELRVNRSFPIPSHLHWIQDDQFIVGWGHKFQLCRVMLTGSTSGAIFQSNVASNVTSNVAPSITLTNASSTASICSNESGGSAAPTTTTTSSSSSALIGDEKRKERTAAGNAGGEGGASLQSPLLLSNNAASPSQSSPSSSLSSSTTAGSSFSVKNSNFRAATTSGIPGGGGFGSLGTRYVGIQQEIFLPYKICGLVHFDQKHHHETNRRFLILLYPAADEPETQGERGGGGGGASTNKEKKIKRPPATSHEAAKNESENAIDIEMEEIAESRAPILMLIEPDLKRLGEYREICIDLLTDLKDAHRNKITDYHLKKVSDDNMYFIVSPRDVVCAREKNADDLVDWLMRDNQFERAIQVAKERAAQLKRHTFVEVGLCFINHLIDSKRFKEAGELCPSFIRSSRVWEEYLWKFNYWKQLRHLAFHIPLEGPHALEPNLYPVILHNLIANPEDASLFVRLIREWPTHLYKVDAIIGDVINHLDGARVLQLGGGDGGASSANQTAAASSASGGSQSHSDAQQPITDGFTLSSEFLPRERELAVGLALLYETKHEYKKAFTLLLRLRNPAVFDLIHRHQLFHLIQDRLIILMLFDLERTIRMLLDNLARMPADTVSSQLEKAPKYRLHYLHALVEQDFQNTSKYHSTLVNLYVEFDHAKLLPFLKRSDQYSLNDALRLCKSKKELFRETIYLLSRVGRSIDALQWIIERSDYKPESEKIAKAIEFCREVDDPDLWTRLIRYSENRMEFIQALLENVGMDIDPRQLIRNIPQHVPFPRLKASLTKLLNDYQVQVNLRSGCHTILLQDTHSLLKSQLRAQFAAVVVRPASHSCFHCHLPLNSGAAATTTSGGELGVAETTKADRDTERGTAGGWENSAAAIAAARHRTPIVVFQCRHVFHRACLDGNSAAAAAATNSQADSKYACPDCASVQFRGA